MASLSPDYAECPLHWLVGTNRYFSKFQTRLEDPNERDIAYNTLLHAAAMSRMENLKIVRLLINCSADVNSLNDCLSTPLHLAVCSRNYFNVDALLEADAYVNPRDTYGRTPLHFAVCMRSSYRVSPFFVKLGYSPIVVRLLWHPEIRVNEVEKMGETPLFWAVKEWNLLAVKELLKKGADPNIPSFSLRTPLHEAFSRRRMLTIKRGTIALQLLQNGAGIYCLDEFQRTPIDILLSKVHNKVTLVFAVRCLNQIALRCNVRESLKNKVRPIPYLDHYLKACCEEVALMKRLVICEHGNLHDFALGCFPTDHEKAVEEVYRPVVEMLLIFGFPIYKRLIFHNLYKHKLGELLKISLGRPSDFVLHPHDTRKSLFRGIRNCYYGIESLHKRLQDAAIYYKSNMMHHNFMKWQ